MKLSGLLAVCFFLFISCGGSNECTGKQVTCPSFNDNLSLQWIPYKANQQLVFNSSTAASDTFTISDVSVSASYPQTVSARQPFCTATANFATAVLLNNQPKLLVEITAENNQYNNAQQNQVYLNIKNGNFQGGGFSDTGIVKSYDLSLSHFYNTATVGSKTFQNVQEVYIDTTKMIFKASQVYKFWIAKNTGIVAYEEYHGNLWVKQ